MGMLNARHVFGPSRAGFEFFQSRLHYRRGSALLLAGSELRLIRISASAGYRAADRDIDRRFVAISRAHCHRLRRVGFRFHPDFRWRDQGVRTIARHHGPGDDSRQRCAGERGRQQHFRIGSGRWTDDAGSTLPFVLMQLPLGIFGVAVATVTLPLVSRSAALGNTNEFRSALAHSVRLVLLLTIPAASGLSFWRNRSFDLIYQHGRFTHLATHPNRSRIAFLRDRSCRIFRRQSARAGLLRARQTPSADVRQPSRPSRSIFL